MKDIPNTSTDVGDASELHTKPYKSRKRKALKAKLKKYKYNKLKGNSNSKKITAGQLMKRKELE